MKNKRKSVITIVAVLTALIGIAVAVGAFLKRKAKDLGEQLDYDGSLYYEDDEDKPDEEDAEFDETSEEFCDAPAAEPDEEEFPEA